MYCKSIKYKCKCYFGVAFFIFDAEFIDVYFCIKCLILDAYPQGSCLAKYSLNALKSTY